MLREFEMKKVGLNWKLFDSRKFSMEKTSGNSHDDPL